MNHECLRDAHLHLSEHGEALQSVDLSSCDSVDACLERAGEACRAGRTRAGDWVICRGARPSGLREGRFPTRDELDAVSEGLALVVRSFDHHSASANALALQRAGLLATPSPDMDAAGGVVWERAYAQLLGAIPDRSDEDERACVTRAQRDLAERGHVLVHDMFATERFVHALAELDRAGALTLDVVCFATPDHVAPVRRAIEALGSERIAFGGLKLFLDGTLSGRTAHMLDPYPDPLPDHPRGQPLIPDDELDAHLRACEELGMGVACHAIGDGAVRRLLEADERLERALGRLPGQTLRIEHAQFIAPEDIERIASRGASGRRLIVSPQPAHLLTDIEAIRTYVPHAETRAFPLRSLVEALRSAGVDPTRHIELGSDAPVVPPDPDDTYQAACQRGRVGMDPDAALGADEALDGETVTSLFRAPA